MTSVAPSSDESGRRDGRPRHAARLYRVNALLRFSSPERAEQLLQVVPGRAWLGLLGLAMAVAGAVLWMALFRMPTYVRASGILLSPGIAGEPVAPSAAGKNASTAGLPVAVVYVPAAQAHLVVAGMAVTVSPSVSNGSGTGAISGRVTHVADYPSSPSNMQQRLNNPFLVKSFSAAGPVVEAWVDLQTPLAGSVPVRTGELVTTDIETREDRLIVLAMPILRRVPGLGE